MVRVEITGYKKITKKGKTIYLLYAISDVLQDGIIGLSTYSAFVSPSHLKKYKIEENSLVGTLADYYTVKDGDDYKSGITFKHTQAEKEPCSTDTDYDLPF